MRKGDIDSNQWKEWWVGFMRVFLFVLAESLTIREDLSNALHERVEAA